MINKSEKRVLRLKLMDFASTPIQEDVICFLENIIKNVEYKLEMHFWYTNEDVNRDIIESFKVECSQFISKFNVRIENLVNFERFAWYDIVNKSDETLLSKFKFRLVYETQHELLSRLVDFNQFAKNYNLGKNNDKTRSNRFTPVAK